MAPRASNTFTNGIWIKGWKFSTDKDPFNNKMTMPTIIKTMQKIEKFACKPLKERRQWKAINTNFTKLVTVPTWTSKLTKKSLTLTFKVKLIDPTGPPQHTIVAPPPPQQPPPPKVLG
jgi:hypothetical protein